MKELRFCTLEICTHYRIGCAKNCRNTLITKVSECSWYQKWNTRPIPDISDIQWVGDCGNCDWKQTPIIKGGETDRGCIKCNGTGKITNKIAVKEISKIITKDGAEICITNTD